MSAARASAAPQAAGAGAAATTMRRPAAPPARPPSEGRRYALVALKAGGPPQYFSEGGTYILPRDAVAVSSSSNRLRFDRVVVVRDGARQRAAATGGASVAFVPDAWVEGEVIEHLDPAHFFGGALSRFRVTRIVAPFGGAEEQVEQVAAAAAAR